MTKVTCDMCEVVIEDRRPPQRLIVKKILERYGPGSMVSAELDLCERCEKAVFDFIFKEGGR